MGKDEKCCQQRIKCLGIPRVHMLGWVGVLFFVEAKARISLASCDVLMRSCITLQPSLKCPVYYQLMRPVLTSSRQRYDSRTWHAVRFLLSNRLLCIKTPLHLPCPPLRLHSLPSSIGKVQHRRGFLFRHIHCSRCGHDAVPLPDLRGGLQRIHPQQLRDHGECVRCGCLYKALLLFEYNLLVFMTVG